MITSIQLKLADTVYQHGEFSPTPDRLKAGHPEWGYFILTDRVGPGVMITFTGTHQQLTKLGEAILQAAESVRLGQEAYERELAERAKREREVSMTQEAWDALTVSGL